ncbi:MAG: spike base protein, RCAP_Rcc01079 family [Alphaproteobacteria bacterium]
MAVDMYKNMMGGLESPAREAVAVTPDDASDLGNTTRSIYVGTSGDIAVRMVGETAVVIFKAVPAGVLPIRADRILATGTTAADLVALW